MEKKKKVLILQNSIFKYRKGLYNNLACYFDVTVLHSGSVSKGDFDYYNEIITKKVKIGGLFFQKGVISEVKSGRYDAVIAMFDLHWVYNLLLPFLFSGDKLKLIYWGNRYASKRLVNNVRSFLMRRVIANILYSERDIPKMIEEGIEGDSIFVAHNTLEVRNHKDTSTFQKDRFIYVGRLQKRKRIDTLIYSFSDIVNSIPGNVILDIIGSGEMEPELKLLVKDLGLQERVFFRGQIDDDEELFYYFSKSFASISIGAIGLSVLHSFSYGVPIITLNDNYHGPEIDNIKNGVNSYNLDSEQELTPLLVKMANQYNVYREIGHNAYKHYSEYRNIKQMTDAFVKAVNS